MGQIKNKKKDEKVFLLSEREYNLLKILNLALQYNVLKDKSISGVCYMIANLRFGFAEDVNLIFEVDLEDDKRELKIKELPKEAIDEIKGSIEHSPQG